MNIYTSLASLLGAINLYGFTVFLQRWNDDRRLPRRLRRAGFNYDKRWFTNDFAYMCFTAIGVFGSIMTLGGGR